MFEQDAEGYLFFKGRLSDFIVRKGDKICLAGVRRIAAQLPHVLRAKTRLVRNNNGNDNYELVLVVNGLNNAEEKEYRAQLRTMLCRYEMPARITVIKKEHSGEDEHCSEYK